MTEATKRPATTLFNNPLLSDVKIKQVAKDGQVREYHAHKAVLSCDSRYFYKAFTGSFREATENTMTCEGDDPDQFEFLLKFMYTEDYDMDAIKKLAAGNKTRRVAFPIELHAIADKYDVCHLLEATLHDVADLLEYEDSLDMLRALIPVHYKSVSIADSAIGNILTTKLLTQHRTFASTDEFTDLVKSQPVFCLDAVFHMGRQKSHACDYCGHVSFPNFSAPLVKITKYVFCENCGNK